MLWNVCVVFSPGVSFKAIYLEVKGRSEKAESRFNLHCEQSSYQFSSITEEEKSLKSINSPLTFSKASAARPRFKIYSSSSAFFNVPLFTSTFPSDQQKLSKWTEDVVPAANEKSLKTERATVLMLFHLFKNLIWILKFIVSWEWISIDEHFICTWNWNCDLSIQWKVVEGKNRCHYFYCLETYDVTKPTNRWNRSIHEKNVSTMSCVSSLSLANFRVKNNKRESFRSVLSSTTANKTQIKPFIIFSFSVEYKSRPYHSWDKNLCFIQSVDPSQKTRALNVLVAPRWFLMFSFFRQKNSQ